MLSTKNKVHDDPDEWFLSHLVRVSRDQLMPVCLIHFTASLSLGHASRLQCATLDMTFKSDHVGGGKE